MTGDRREAERLRAEEWCWHFMRGNVSEAVQVELSGPPIRPSLVLAAVMGLLADGGLVLAPMSAEAPQEDERIR